MQQLIDGKMEIIHHLKLYFQFFRLICIKIRHCFCFIKEYYLSIYFHKTYLVCIRHFFSLSSKPVIIGNSIGFYYSSYRIIFTYSMCNS